MARFGSGTSRDERVDPFAQLGLFQLAVGVPRRRVGPARGDEREAVKRDRVGLAEGDEARRVDDRIDLEHVVVRRRHDAAHLGDREALVGECHPALDPAQHLVLEPRIHQGRVGRPRLELRVRHANRVVAPVADPLLDRADLVLGRELLALSLEGHLPAPAMVDDRHHGLAGHVAAHDQDIGLVEGAGIEELAPADLGPVDVGREEDPHIPGCPTSSGSLYHCCRSPTRARSFQRVDLGAASIAVRNAAIWGPGG